jgi:aquaporin Z
MASRSGGTSARRLFSELYGTFLLVIVAAGGGMMGQAVPNTVSRTAAVVAPGLMVLGIIMFMGKVSGAHLNPAVSVAFALRGDFPWRRVPGYIIVQWIGATLAALLLHGVVDVSASFGFGPDLAAGKFTDYWVYVAGPLTGVIVAVGLAYVLRGAGGGRAGSAAAQGDLFTEVQRSGQK